MLVSHVLYELVRSDDSIFYTDRYSQGGSVMVFVKAVVKFIEEVGSLSNTVV